MLRCRLLRMHTAFVAVMALLLSQLALASYVCPGMADAGGMASSMAAGAPCGAMDPDQPSLCHRHVSEPGKAFEAVKLPVLSLPLIVCVFELPLVLETEAGTVGLAATTGEARPPPDPLFLSTLRLRV